MYAIIGKNNNSETTFFLPPAGKHPQSVETYDTMEEALKEANKLAEKNKQAVYFVCVAAIKVFVETPPPPPIQIEVLKHVVKV